MNLLKLGYSSNVFPLILSIYHSVDASFFVLVDFHSEQLLEKSTIVFYRTFLIKRPSNIKKDRYSQAPSNLLNHLNLETLSLLTNSPRYGTS